MATLALASYKVRDLPEAPKGNPRHLFEEAKQFLRFHPEVAIVSGPHRGESGKVERLKPYPEGIACRVTVPSTERAGQRVGFWVSTRALKPKAEVPETLTSLFAMA